MHETGAWLTPDGQIVVRSAAGIADWVMRSQDGAEVSYADALPEGSVPLVRADEAQSTAEWLMYELLWSALGFAKAGPYSPESFDFVMRIRALAIDRDETERERVKALERERNAAERLQQLRESPEMRLAIAHRDDCRTYEGIIEASMASLGVEKYGELPEAARNARLVAEWLIAEVRYRYSHFYDRMRADLDGVSPEATRPAHLRFAATIIEQTAVPKDHGGDGEDQERTARQLRDEANRIETAAAADEDLVEVAARVIWGSRLVASTTDAETAAHALHSAGLLRDGDVA
ncbi:hypothetical protein [Gordonia sp. OPL2]|uniref:hypothetical protein n=1 Tax=Gordonia sp. OPL2 TaxID=2486274 RepID=UPI00165654A3|nr:hypothetical protein [Gordonia sp. OPL2]ROZ88985.1 hypothetical protein EEB19_19945 [Gordonia sp. OPL2]